MATVVDSTAPSAMNAPATTPSTNVVNAGAFAFATPRVSTRPAISPGEKASWPVIGWGVAPLTCAS